ncbi:translation initiation factor IF-2 [Esox lucius]|uniref:translation initiation factor IF-2 n=1 Tax=Esox lucius TaxID=8010 RepID=UPI000577A02A|nr:translation initiation factor IF-2 [Esox lucius]
MPRKNKPGQYVITMSGKYPKLKLKRRKLNVEGPCNDTLFKNTIVKKNGNSSASIESSTRPALPTEAWWSRGDLTAVESLWALTLSSTLPCPEAHPWGPVADLPTASKLSSTMVQLCEWRWCSLSEMVTPLPCSSASPLSPPPMTPPPSNTDSPRNTSTGVEQPIPHIPGQTRQRTSTADGPPSGFSPRPGGPGEGTSCSGAGRYGPPVLGARVPASYRGGGQRGGGEERSASSQRRPKHVSVRKAAGSTASDFTTRQPGGGESHPSFPHHAIFGASSRGSTLPEGFREGGGVEGEEIKRRRLPGLGMEASSSDRRTAAPLGEGEGKEEGVSGKRGTDWDASGGGGGEEKRGGEGVPQSCPMCLVPFPAGLTQMDCDAHLAKCLSEMTVDITW